MTRFEDLPAHIQKQIRSGASVPPPKKAAPHPPGPPQPRSQQWKCHDCGQVFAYWARAEIHSRDLHHGRIELVLPGEQ